MAANRTDAPGPPRPFRPAKPVVIGLTGGVAAGKSTVAGLFGAHDLVVIDADAHARAVATDPTVLAAVGAEFGAETVAGGKFDRAALARIVFADPAARQRLEAILHPPIRARILAELDAARAGGSSVVLDAPLLLETGLVEFCDHTVHVEAAAAVRRQRAAARGWDEGEFERREAAQTPLAVKKARAMHTIHSDGELEDTARDVAHALDRLAAIG